MDATDSGETSELQQPHVWSALAYEQKGEWDKAIAEMEKSRTRTEARSMI